MPSIDLANGRYTMTKVPESDNIRIANNASNEVVVIPVSILMYGLQELGPYMIPINPSDWRGVSGV